MIRKVLQQGPSSLVVSLPSKWVKERDIKKGQEIDIQRVGNRLVIKSEITPEQKEVSIDISNLERKVIEKYVTAAYKKGYSNIIFTYKNKNALDLKQSKEISIIEIIQERVKKLIGLEVTSNENNKCVLNEVAQVKEEELTNITKQCIHLTLQFINSIYDSIKSPTSPLSHNEIDLQEDNIDKFSLLALRIINTKGLRKDSLSSFNSIVNLEEISDELAYFSKELSTSNKPSKNLLQMYESVIKSAELMQSIYFTFNHERINEFIKLRRQFFSLLKKTDSSEYKHVHLLSNILNKMLNIIENKISLNI